MIWITHSSIKGYPRALLGVCLVVCGLFFTSGHAQAESYDITATVPAPLPTQPAIITSHHDQQHVTDSEAHVQGTCSNDTAYVELFRNDVLAGTTLCQTGSFALVITFLPGINSLQAKAFSSTGGAGPLVPPIAVYYDIVQPPIEPSRPSFPPFTSPPQSSCSPLVSSLPFFLTADQLYGSHQPGEHISRALAIEGGCAPYVLTTDWGDGVVSVKEFVETTHTFDHTYLKPGYYLVKLQVTDSAGNKAHLQLVIVIQGTPVEPTRDTAQPRPDWLVPTITAAAGSAVVLTIFGRRAIVRIVKYLLGKMR
jgi:PKD domain-containing protein